MNAKEILEYLGRLEGRHLHIQKQPSHHLPYIRVLPDGSFKCGNFTDHENAPRMPPVASLFKQKLDIKPGFYVIELQDSLFDNPKRQGFPGEYDNCLVWSRPAYTDAFSRNTVLIPDPFQLTGYGGRVGPSQIPLFDPRIGFFGRTTGNRDPALNRRVQTCLAFAELDPLHRSSDCFVTQIVQMSPEAAQQIPARIRSAVQPHNKIFTHRYVLDIEGNTAAWSRVPEVMHSGTSLLMRLTGQRDVTFYTPLMQPYVHYVPVEDARDALKKKAYYDDHPGEREAIVANAQRFARDFLTQDAAFCYLKALFNRANENAEAPPG